MKKIFTLFFSVFCITLVSSQTIIVSELDNSSKTSWGMDINTNHPLTGSGSIASGYNIGYKEYFDEKIVIESRTNGSEINDSKVFDEISQDVSEYIPKIISGNPTFTPFVEVGNINIRPKVCHLAYSIHNPGGQAIGWKEIPVEPGLQSKVLSNIPLSYGVNYIRLRVGYKFYTITLVYLGN